MKAIVFHKPKDMRFEEVADPTLEAPEDVILRVTSTAICGSDLHIYNGFFPQKKPIVMGHEFMGIVEEKGPGVNNQPFPRKSGHSLAGLREAEHETGKQFGWGQSPSRLHGGIQTLGRGPLVSHR